MQHAACYGGHQFGSFAGQLGDGRAISLGEVLTAADDRWELQLKGAERVVPRVSTLVGLGAAVIHSMATDGGGLKPLLLL